MKNTIDTSDLDKRLQELLAMRDAVAEAETNAEAAIEEARSATLAGESSEAALDAAEALDEADMDLEDARILFGHDEQEELKGLQELEIQISEWSNGATLIPKYEFVEYCRKLLEDIGDIPKNLPSYIVVDWEATAENLKVDYAEVTYKNETYLVCPRMKTIKAKNLAVKYNPTGERLVWRFWREPKVYGGGRYFPHWTWEDEEGYKRYGPSTWAEFVPYLRGYFQSYNVTPLQDFNHEKPTIQR